MNDPARFWADPRLVYAVAAAAVALLLVTLWLFGRRRRQGRQAAVICLMLSIGLHVALLFLVPLLPSPNGGSASPDRSTKQQAGVDAVEFSTFDPDISHADVSSNDPDSQITPLPVSDLTDLLEPSPQPNPESTDTVETTDDAPSADHPETVPDSLLMPPEDSPSEMIADIESELGTLLQGAFASVDPAPISTDAADARSTQVASRPASNVTQPNGDSPPSRPPAASTAPRALVPGELKNDFANRVGKAKEMALLQTGGNTNTEAAVEAALRFLVNSQRPDGAWDPRASGAGNENRLILGIRRPGTGSRAESAITGLALLTLMGAGQTHLQGDYADNVYRGLAYLIRSQSPSGSLAGDAAPYAANYSHGMAALSICEAAAITQDAAAIKSAERAVRFTLSQQHPTTGGWRYLPSDPGDLSQLGWQAMVLDAGNRAQIPLNPRSRRNRTLSAQCAKRNQRRPGELSTG